MSDALLQPPMGRLDTIDIASKKMTIQTEFFERPEWRIETKVYLGGALKKVYTEDLTGRDPDSLQAAVIAFHEQKMNELVASLKKMQG